MIKNIIFGAGPIGRRAVIKYKKETIDYFIDNGFSKVGTVVDGFWVKSVADNINDIKTHHIIIASRHWKEMKRQLDELGISDYEVYGVDTYFDIPELIYNPYTSERTQDEEMMCSSIQTELQEFVDKSVDLFNHIEIETINRCNGVCSFCPVNRNVDKRPFCKMSDELFENIISQLERINYSGRIALFSNNEPFLDNRILYFHKIARDKLPLAKMHLCTNGTLLTLDKFVEIMKYLDELMIDNYNQNLEILPNVQEIVDYCEKNPGLKNKVTVILRKPQEILTNRGGDSPNKRPEGTNKIMTGCLLPFKQMIIRPDGKVSLCCNDALGKCTMGDVTKETLLDIWQGEKFSMARRKLQEGRQSFARCANCDTLYMC